MAPRTTAPVLPIEADPAQSRPAPSSDTPDWTRLLRPGKRVAVLGATGLVGIELLWQLEERGVPAAQIDLLASKRSAGRTVRYAGSELTVQEATPTRLANASIVLASAGGDVSRDLLPGAAAAGAICIDNSSAFRMDESTPLVVPEVNGHALEGISLDGPGRIIANPNCSTAQLVCALAPIHAAAGLRRVVVSTYQSVSGAGREALNDLRAATGALLDGGTSLDESLGHVPAFDVHPGIGDQGPGKDAEEEAKLVHETVKILGAPVQVDAHSVRVPVMLGHAESVTLETYRPLPLAEAREALRNAPGVRLAEPDAHPTPRTTARTTPVHVGRLRPSRVFTNGLQMWVVADNLLKGAALNAVQIADHVLAAGARR